ncbi:MAG: hypothetical protein ABFS19_07875 [Thermodesulfobacteriota bacterium]
MRIKTEILKSIFIITCEGDELNPSPIEVFLTSMAVMIERNRLDILVDLSAVKAVEGGKLGTVARALVRAESSEFLILSGVSEREFNLLRMTNLQDKITHATNRNEALSILYWERKKAIESGSAEASESLAAIEEAVKKSAAEEAAAAAAAAAAETPAEAETGEEVYIVHDDDLEIVSTPETFEPEEDLQGGKQYVDTGKAYKIIEKEGKRKHRRVQSSRVMKEEFIVFCKNTVTGKHHTAVIIDFSVVSLRMNLSPPRAEKGDELLIEGRVGKLFKLKEHVVFHCRREDGFVFHFKDLSPEAFKFLGQMTLK